MIPSKHIWQKILVNNYSYAILRPLLYLAERLKASRKNYLEKDMQHALRMKADKIFRDGMVRNGPFAGIRLAGNGSGASSNFAKLLGSYEQELHGFLIPLFQIPFKQIINIGSDDGYYAIGFAQKFPEAQVFAYDSNPVAAVLTESNAKLNEIQNIQVRGAYTKNTLQQHDARARSLFIVDCEGAEKDIFTADTAQLLKHSDLLIELHLHIHPELHSYFTELFSTSHDIEMVESIPDHRKVMEYQYPELSGMNFTEKKFIVEERDVYMQWIWLRSKSGPND